MSLKKHKLILLVFPLIFFSTLSAAGRDNYPSLFSQVPPPIDSMEQVDSSGLEIIEKDSAEAVLADSMMTTDSTLPDIVIIEPNLISLGSDSILISAYAVDPVDTVLRQAPSTALVKSVLFPGWGQYSNGKHLKAALILSIESYFIYRAVELGVKTSDWRDKWREAPDDLKSEYFLKYTDYRDRRNSFIWYTAITIFISMFDAYVDAHLAPFPEKIRKPEEISFGVDASERFEINLTYRF